MDLAIALHRRAMYPPGHSSLLPSLDALAKRAEALFRDRSRIAVGVARNQLIIDGVATEVRHPLLRGLAERLHRHHLAALDFSLGLTVDELTAVVAAIAEDPDRGGGPLGAAAEATGTHAWPHVRLHALSIEGLDIVDPGEGNEAAGCRSAELWIGLANAALERASGESEPALRNEPGVVARAIDENHGVEAYDQVIVGYLLQIAKELGTNEGAGTAVLRRRTAQLVGALQPETLRRLLGMGGDARQRRRFVSDAAAGMAAGAVVDLVQAAATASEETISSGLLRMLTKLAAHAEAGCEEARALADSALREQVQRLIGGWALVDPNPDEYRASLNRLARRHAEGLAARATWPFADPLRILQMSIELDEDVPGLSDAVDGLVADLRVPALVEILGAAGSSGLAERLRTKLVSVDTVNALLAGDRPDLEGLDALLPYLQGDTLVPLFEVMTHSENRHLRRAAFDRLRAVQAASAPLALARLGSDERWYVARNLLALIAHFDTVPEDFDPSPWLGDNDGRVRREALRVALRVDQLRDFALQAGLADTDPRVLAVALAAVQDHCPPRAVPALLELAARDTLDDDLRGAALRALGTLRRDSRALELLLKFAPPETRRLFWSTQTAKSQSSLAALAALAAAWPEEPRAAAVLKRAAGSRDEAVRRAAGGAS
jgi:hypothetical protein